MTNEVEAKIEKRQILVFNLLQEELGLDIANVCEVLRPQHIHPLPHAPEFIEGVINLRKHIIAVMDLRKKFNIKAREDLPKIRIIICRIKKFVVGLIVDSVNEVLSLSEGNIQPTPEVVSLQIENSYISKMARVGERVITILDLENILTAEEMVGLGKLKK